MAACCGFNFGRLKSRAEWAVLTFNVLDERLAGDSKPKGERLRESGAGEYC